MPFVQGKCENCGGILTVDPSLKAAICPFCGTAYVVQDSINHYNTTIKVESMHADVVNVIDESSSEARLKAGDAYQKIGRYDLAAKEYRIVTEKAPHNHLGWLGLIEALTYNYSKRIKSASELKTLDDYALSVTTFAPNSSGYDLTEKWRNYLKIEEERNAVQKEPIIKVLSERANELKSLFDESNALTAKIEQNEKRQAFLFTNYNLNETNKVTGSGCLLGVGLLFLPIGLIILSFILSTRDDPDFSTILIVSIILILLGSGGLFGSIMGHTKKNRFRNEAIRLKKETESAKKRLAEISQIKSGVVSEISSKQKLLDEYK